MTRTVKQACVDCHYFKKHNASNPNSIINHHQREAIRKKDFSWLNDAFALCCHRGIWDEGIDPELVNKRNEIIDKERKDTCFFYEFTSGMTFQAAQDLQKKKASEARDKPPVTYVAGDQFNQTGNFQGANIKSTLKDVNQTIKTQEPDSILTQDISFRADIHLEILEYGFSPSHGGRRSPFRDVQRSQGGFNKEGLPDWGYLWANIRVANHGREDGQLVWEVGQQNIRLPSLFTSEKFSVESNLPRNVAGRKSYRSHLFLDILLVEREPNTFAKAMKALVVDKESYQIVVRYKTRCVDGESKSRELCFAGDFHNFCQKVLKHWEDYSFNDLVELVQIS